MEEYECGAKLRHTTEKRWCKRRNILTCRADADVRVACLAGGTCREIGDCLGEGGAGLSERFVVDRVDTAGACARKGNMCSDSLGC